MSEIIINIATDYTQTPGSRYISDGLYSGEDFRKKFLEPLFKNPSDNRKIIVILDGTEGYATSFVEEAFGGIAREYGKNLCMKRFEFISDEDPTIKKRIIEYIKRVPA